MWGCTCWSKNSLFHSRVFPTHVGVYRCERLWQKMADCFPHACGGVPPQFQISESLNSFSPRMWGCTDYIALMERNYEVFPTHVGVYLRLKLLRLNISSFPHACGGVPGRYMARWEIEPFSPRMWGCTVSVSLSILAYCRFPHACGGVPVELLFLVVPASFSPRMWGCTPLCSVITGIPLVFPTHVGVYLMIGDHQCNKTSFSPRMWGCTDHSGSPRTDEAVFPTHVGVYRMIILVCKYCEKFSPRMWGCT